MTVDKKSTRAFQRAINQGSFYAAPNFLKMGIKYLNLSSFGTNILAGGSSVPLISERKGPRPNKSTCVAHTSLHSAAAVTSLRH